ncbi:hypothetical protein [Variovorax sp. Sphag1AA]|uniref:hypothetical protein n=1 Tax=Variovorax sp. Sphag1AA TaxID=2587027 RepID=UPI001C85D427|nr:hypothetical protein [Variovorax sp. Sphag1AA]
MAQPPTPPRATGYARTQFMMVKIPVVADVDDLYHQREDRIDQALKAKGLGTVIGWGDSLGEARGGRSRRVAYTRVDLDVVEVEAARAELQAVLAAIGTPAGTEIHYSRDGVSVADVFAPPDWQIAQPMLHGVRDR